jgi:hypothetical protein
MERSLNKLAEEGWKFVSTQALLEGQYRLPIENEGDELSLGYSVTSSLLVFLEKDSN